MADAASGAAGPPSALRLFFALWPGAEVAAALAARAAEAQRCWGGRAVPRASLHLTLAFLGAVAPDRLPGLAALAAGLAAGGCTLRLERLEWRRRQGLVWAAPGAVPPPLAQLADALTQRLAGAGLRTEARTFAAHVTLLRRARTDGAVQVPMAPLDWPVRDFVLVQSELRRDGARYRIRGRWRLADGGTGCAP